MESPQLEQWMGDFGDAYIDRNRPTDRSTALRVEAFQRIFAGVPDSSSLSFLEVGANIGNNLRALRKLTNGALYAVEPNLKAYNELISVTELDLAGAYNVSAFDLPISGSSIDCAFTFGVLIHIHPDDLHQACSEIVRVAKRYVLCAEYFSPEPEEKNYRGQTGLLFKRDFGSFYLDNWPHLKVIDYGFLWKRTTIVDNINWWLFEKSP